MVQQQLATLPAVCNALDSKCQRGAASKGQQGEEQRSVKVDWRGAACSCQGKHIQQRNLEQVQEGGEASRPRDLQARVGSRQNLWRECTNQASGTQPHTTMPLPPPSLYLTPGYHDLDDIHWQASTNKVQAKPTRQQGHKQRQHQQPHTLTTLWAA